MAGYYNHVRDRGSEQFDPHVPHGRMMQVGGLNCFHDGVCYGMMTPKE